LKRIPPKLTQHIIELDNIIPLTHQARYILNPNYATTIKQNINKLLVVRFVESIEEATWVVTHSNSTQEKWQVENLYKFWKTKCSHKKGSIPITFH
jgi:hypothetical protein